MANLNLKTHPLKDSPKPSTRPQHIAETYKPALFKGTGKLAERHRSHVDRLRDFKPLHDRVLVKRIEEKPKGLIIIRDVDKEPSREVEIIALGPKANWGYQVGDIVLVSPSINMDYSDLIDDNGDYVLIQQADILCIVE